MEAFTYILYSKDVDTYYVGSCVGIDNRVKKHNGNHKGFTNRAKDWVCVYSETNFELKVARKREREIKSRINYLGFSP